MAEAYSIIREIICDAPSTRGLANVLARTRATKIGAALGKRRLEDRLMKTMKPYRQLCLYNCLSSMSP